VHRAGQCRHTGLAFVDMELCAEFVEGSRRRGRSLASTPARDLDEAVRWMSEVARGLGALHDAGLQHPALSLRAVMIRPESRRAQLRGVGAQPANGPRSLGRAV